MSWHAAAVCAISLSVVTNESQLSYTIVDFQGLVNSVEHWILAHLLNLWHTFLCMRHGGLITLA